MGYQNLRYYIGGMADWLEHGGPVQGSATTVLSAATGVVSAKVSRRLSWLERLANFSLERLVGVWFGMIVAFGLIYWLAGLGMGSGLQAGSSAVKADWDGLWTASYFSFVTALSIGYGDVVPLGVFRILAI